MVRLKKSKEEYDGDLGFRRGRVILIIIVLTILISIVWQGNYLATSPEPRTLVVYCFTGMQEVMERGMFPAFQGYWEKEQGEHVEFIPTFAGSGTIVDKIISRFPAEVAILSSPIDAIRLSERVLVPAKSWEGLPNGGVFSRSPMIMIVREGNPLVITDFSDLRNPGMEVIHPDPISSGAGQWALLAIYGSALKASGDSLEALKCVERIWRNVVDRPASTRDAVQQFIGGAGDVLITYEANLQGNAERDQIPGQLIYPQSTMVSEHIVLPINKNIRRGQKELVDAFIQFLWSDKAQYILTTYGFNSVLDTLDHIQPASGHIHDAFTLDSLGGPRRVKRSIVEKLTQTLIPPSSY